MLSANDHLSWSELSGEDDALLRTLRLYAKKNGEPLVPREANDLVDAFPCLVMQVRTARVHYQGFVFDFSGWNRNPRLCRAPALAIYSTCSFDALPEELDAKLSQLRKMFGDDIQIAPSCTKVMLAYYQPELFAKRFPNQSDLLKLVVAAEADEAKFSRRDRFCRLRDTAAMVYRHMMYGSDAEGDEDDQENED